MTALPNLEARKDLEEVVHHLKGLVEATEEISAQMKILDATIGNDLDRATDAMGRLEAEIYTHLAYHVKELRKPFSRLFHALGRELEGQEKDHAKDMR